ncbi:alpha/beta fold hydrolase [Pendulispora albinea]|uniref:Non-ribosomal peptide synthetase n=1 Tax=Pendulispora albinea TaxID=2741071 RepID=A0ABZ2LST3_9BACT
MLLRAAFESQAGVTYFGASAQSYASLLVEARRILGGLRARGLRPGARVVLLLERPSEFLPSFWAAVLGGFLPCPLAPARADANRWRADLQHVHDLLEQPLFVVTRGVRAEMPEVPGLSIAVLEDLAAAPEDTRAYESRPSDPTLLMLTSGSTGRSKAVMLRHENLFAALAGKTAALAVTGRDIMMNWISFDHIAAIEGHLLPMWAFAGQVQAEPQAILSNPINFLEVLAIHKVTLTFAPNFLYGLINKAIAYDALRSDLDLSSVRHIISGGEAAVVATAKAFLDALAPFGLARSVIVPAFGMTETCAGSVFSLDFPAVDEGLEFASLGHPVKGLEIRVVDENDATLPNGQAGELQVRGPMVTEGYFNNMGATWSAFTVDGWFRTGDLGKITDGRLTLVGRSKDSIIVNGVNYFSHDLENSLEQLEGVEKSYVAAFPIRPKGTDTEQVAVVFSPTDMNEEGHVADEEQLYRLMMAIRSGVVLRWGFRPAVVLPVAKSDMPKTSLGKLQRSALRKRLESGAFAGREKWVAELTTRQTGGYVAPKGEVEVKLAEIYGEMFNLAPAKVSATANFFDLGGTSLDVLRFKLIVQRRLNLPDLPVAWLLQSQTVQKLAKQLAGSGDDAYDPLVVLQASGHRTPLFCVHPGVGEVLVFVNLAKYFVNERPFYALRARGFGPRESHFGTFEEMVDTYVKAIRAQQPSGPYAVAGYSYGGAVAFEIAKKLEALGERVDFVGIFNLPPHISTRMNEIGFADGAVNLAVFLSLFPKEEAADVLRNAIEKSLDHQQQLGYIISRASKSRLVELDLDLAKFGAWVDLAQTMVKLGRTYEPSGSVKSLSVFYCQPLKGTKEDWLNLQLREWDGFARQENRYIDVAGEHYTLMSPQHVQSFQATLRQELDRALEGK